MTLCDVCTEVFEIYKTLESVAPWLCQCETPDEALEEFQFEWFMGHLILPRPE